MMYNMNVNFSDIKLSIRNRMDDFDIFLLQYFY